MAANSRQPENDFESVDSGHQDTITVIGYNFYGKRKVTGSADHRLKVYDHLPDGQWKLIDTWRGHDAEILDAKWSTPFVGQVIGSIGEDQKFKVWQEDVYEPPNSGHRFKCIFTHQSSSRVPYVSFDFKTIDYSDVHVALVSRDALLTVYEANEPESMASWAIIDQFHVCTPPSRGEETAFKVQFDPNALPCWAACRTGVRADALSLVTAGMNTAKIWRTNAHRQFYLAADLSPHHHGLIRDVSWAPHNIRGWDLVATACTDGHIRVFEIHPSGPNLVGSTTATAANLLLEPSMSTLSGSHRTIGGGSHRGNGRNGRRTVSSSSSHQRRSGIGAGLAGAAAAAAAASSSSTSSNLTRHHHFETDVIDSTTDGESQVTHLVKQVAAIRDRYGGVWQVSWRSSVHESMELSTSHEDGSVRIWKYAPPLIDSSTVDYRSKKSITITSGAGSQSNQHHGGGGDADNDDDDDDDDDYDEGNRNGGGGSDDVGGDGSDITGNWIEYSVVETDDDHNPISYEPGDGHHDEDDDR